MILDTISRKRAVLFIDACIIAVIFMMAVGALTRLTGSGLSIPDWPLINGTLLYPISTAEWTAVFERYKEFPQYHLINKNLALDEFKIIFFYEYFHRSITSFVSLFLLFSLFYVLRSKNLRQTMKWPYLVLVSLLLSQAMMGYLMVKSGLEPGRAAVSPIRLSLHLSLALIFLGMLFFTRWRLVDGVKKWRLKDKWALIILCIICIQLISGAFMAGTKAGFLFSDWPFMNGKLIPDNLFSDSVNYKNNFLLNFLENSVTIHFSHRLIAYILLIIGIYYSVREFMQKGNRSSSLILFFSLMLCQVILGIVTVITYVPIYIALLHHITAVLLFLSILKINYETQWQYEN